MEGGDLRPGWGGGGHAVLLISLSRLGGKTYSSFQTSPTAQPRLAGEGENRQKANLLSLKLCQTT